MEGHRSKTVGQGVLKSRFVLWDISNVDSKRKVGLKKDFT
jgi:hypothetical protein